MIKIYSTSWCSPCASAKKLLKELNLSYEEIDIEKQEITRQELMKITGGTTVPQIIINGKSIGGFDKLLELTQNGNLQEMLKLCGNLITHFFFLL